MFNWFRKKKPALTESEKDAYEFGQKAAGSMIETLDHYMATRFEPVHENYLNVLKEKLRNAITSEDASPITLGRVEYSVFLDYVKELQPKMIEELERFPARLNLVGGFRRIA